MRVFWLLALVPLFFPLLARGQAGPGSARAAVQAGPITSWLRISQVIIKGNRRTRDAVILRELDLLPGTLVPLADTATRFQINANKVFNTRLFVTATVQTAQFQPAPDSLLHASASLVVTVRELIYIRPIPILELADRSINEWYYNQKADLRRINAGLKVTQENLTGYNDPLKFTFQLGFLHKYELGYSFPLRNLNSSLEFKGHYSTNDQVAVNTRENKQQFRRDSLSFGRIRRYLQAGYNLRQGFYGMHSFDAVLHHNSISDFVAQLNPNYFGDGRRQQRLLELAYTYTFDYRDRRQYPLKGYYVQAELMRQGVLPGDNINITSLATTYTYFHPMGRNWFAALGLDGVVSTPASQPYMQWRAMGMGRRYVRGYDKYVIEGQHFFILKSTVRKLIFTHNFRYDWVPVEQLRLVPVQVYLKAYADAGYMHNSMTQPTNGRLTNKALPGGGMGLDIVTSYDAVFRIEYSVNKFGERSFFFYLTTDI